jgi:hypothetical protein
MRRKSQALLLAVYIVLPALGGCGGGSGGSHTYIEPMSGADVTIVSPVAIPTGFLTRNGAYPLLSKPRGPQVCSYEKTVQGGTHSMSYLNGKTLTLKVNGPKRWGSPLCAHFKKKTPIVPIAFQPLP